jgi:D-inositol-3-phosphate glycosyltransferase
MYVAGNDPGTWSSAVGRLLSDDAAHAELRAAGLRHARGYSWHRVAETVVADVRA